MNTVTVRAAAITTVTNFNDFDALQDLISTDASFSMCDTLFDMLSVAVRQNGFTIELNITLSAPVLLDEIRIDIKGLMRWSRLRCRGGDSNLRISLEYSCGTGLGKEVTIVSMVDLQKRVFLLLSHLLSAWPQDVDPYQSKTLPSIWINGRGALLEVTYPANPGHTSWSYPYQHSALRKQEVVQIGYRRAMELDYQIFSSFYKGGDGVHQNLKILRRAFWSDWVARRPRSEDVPLI
jgi:hypothetical protein